MKGSYKSKNFYSEGEKWETRTAGRKEMRNALEAGSCKLQMKLWTWWRGPCEYVVVGGESFCVREYKQSVYIFMCIYIFLHPAPQISLVTVLSTKLAAMSRFTAHWSHRGIYKVVTLPNDTQIWKFSAENRKAQAPKLLFRFLAIVVVACV